MTDEVPAYETLAEPILLGSRVDCWLREVDESNRAGRIMPRRLALEAPHPITPEWAALVAGIKIGDVLRLGQKRDVWRVTKVEGLAVEMVLV